MYVHACETTIQVKEYFQQLRRVFAAPSFFNFGCTGAWLWRGLLVAVQGLSSVVELWGFRASVIAAPGLCSASLEVWYMGPAAACHVEPSLTRDPTCIPCIGGQTPNHWTTRKVLLPFRISTYFSHISWKEPLF